MTVKQASRLPQRCMRLAACVGMVAVLAACGSSPRAPVENRSIGVGGVPRVDPATLPGYAFQGKPGYYTVQPGETMRSIARNQGQDWRDLARWNSQWVPNPDQIEVGQVLRVVAPPGSTPRVAAASPAPTVSRPAAAPRASSEPAAPAAASSQPAAAGGISLSWPTQGRTIVTPYDEVRSKGIGIAGKEGEPILAAADGTVMYAGSGLRGYGNLVILKHNNTFLTVYAHNSKLLVKENQSVKKGQTIAEMGRTDADRVKLHFEVRRNGRTVNPMGYLSR